MSKLTQEFVREFFSYDPETGVFKRIRKRRKGGKIVDCDFVPAGKTAYGYLQMNANGERPYAVHRLIFLYMTGALPVEDVDHINGDRSDNRWCNLRLVDRQTNLKNVGVRHTNTSGQTGVSYASDRNKWHAYINVDKGVRLSLGYFLTIEEATKTRLVAEKLLGYHENHGKRDGWRE